MFQVTEKGIFIYVNRTFIVIEIENLLYKSDILILTSSHLMFQAYFIVL